MLSYVLKDFVKTQRILFCVLWTQGVTTQFLTGSQDFMENNLSSKL